MIRQVLRIGHTLAAPGLARSALATVAVRLIDLPTRYGLHLLVAASLGVEEAGRFYIVFGVMTALGGFGRLGVDQALMRHIATLTAMHRTAEARFAVFRAARIVFLLSAIAALALAAAAAPLAQHLLGKPELAIPLAIGALSLLPQNLGTVTAGALAGLQRVGLSQMVYSWLWPACFCLVALITGLDLTGALWLIAASFATAATIGALLLRRVLPPSGGSRPAARPGLLRQGASLFTLEYTQLMVASVPALILGILSTNREVGLFALAWRVALLVNIAIGAVAAMAAPRYAALHAKGDTAGLDRAAAHAIGLSLLLALPPLAVMLALPQTLLQLFGPGYADGAAVLRILAFGQLAAAASAAMPALLGMTGHLSDLRRLNAVSLLLLCAGFPLAAAWGAVGIALAVAAVLAVNGLGAMALAHRRLGLRPWRLLADFLTRRATR